MLKRNKVVGTFINYALFIVDRSNGIICVESHRVGCSGRLTFFVGLVFIKKQCSILVFVMSLPFGSLLCTFFVRSCVYKIIV